jgi:serine/threonine protein kinase
LHSRGITHRDIKPDNVLVELEPHFKVVLSDFGLSKAVTETTWLETFCGTLKYLAPEVFPCSLFRYGPPADIWSLGVMALEWLHTIPAPPEKPERELKNVTRDQWRDWSQTWVDLLTSQLDDQEGSADVELLQGMVVVDQRKRLSAYSCLKKGLKNGLFRR